MARFARRGRISAREQLERNIAVAKFYAPTDGPGVARAQERIASMTAQLKPKRERAAPRGTSDVPLERTVLQNVIAVLKADPRVSKVERNTSGSFVSGSQWVNVGVKGKLDLTVYLRSGRYMEIEVKRPGGKPKPHQQRRIDEIRADGGLAGYCWSAESALALLP